MTVMFYLKGVYAVLVSWVFLYNSASKGGSDLLTGVLFTEVLLVFLAYFISLRGAKKIGFSNT